MTVDLFQYQGFAAGVTKPVRFVSLLKTETRRLRIDEKDILVPDGDLDEAGFLQANTALVLPLSARNAARRAGSVSAGRILIDGKVPGGVETDVLRDRMKLAHDGVVIIILSIERLTGKVVSGPDVVSRGFVFEDASQELLSEVKDLVMDTLTLMIPEAKGDWSLVSARVRSALKKFINKRLDRRPMILPIIMEV